MATIFELTAQATELYELLQADEIDEQTFADTLEAMGVGEKVESYCKVIKQLQADAEMFKTEIARLTARKQAAENGVDRMKAALLLYLQQSGQNKVKAGSFSVYTATTPVVNVTDESALPLAYLKPQPPTVDKIAIKAAIKGGETVAGAELVNNVGVRIR